MMALATVHYVTVVFSGLLSVPMSMAVSNRLIEILIMDVWHCGEIEKAIKIS
jgi:hypothetical protein